jgi:hypothetical protein
MSNTTSTIAEDNKALAMFNKAAEQYGKASGNFRQKTVATVEALRAEGYEDKVIRMALRAVVEKHGVTPQHLNRVLTAPVAEGGAGMAKERNREKSGSDGVKSGLAKDAAKGGVTVKLTDPTSLFAALIVEFEGDATKVLMMTEKLNELARLTIEKGATK